ncbi:MAG: hypothetical protein D6680_17345 [Cyanobacteria bacterium J007]|nr:MAG: hypothetical protein D6680_17345 [Cyanobacteria bacterium J007]
MNLKYFYFIDPVERFNSLAESAQPSLKSFYRERDRKNTIDSDEFLQIRIFCSMTFTLSAIA